MATELTMRCEQVAEMLPAFVRDGDVPLSMRRHLGRCADCKAELARYETLMTALASLEGVTSEPPVGLMASLAAIPASASRLDAVKGQLGSAREHVARHRAAYVGGAAVALAGVGAAVWRTRRGRLAGAPARA